MNEEHFNELMNWAEKRRHSIPSEELHQEFMTGYKDIEMNEQKQATPAEEIRRKFMDHSTPLTEAGHWARRHIEQLEAENKRLRDAIARISETLTDTPDGSRVQEMQVRLGVQQDQVETLQARLSNMTQAVGLASTLNPGMEIDVENPVGMIQEVVEYVKETSKMNHLPALYLADMANATAWLNFTTAQANHDLQRYGEWRCDYVGQASVFQQDYENAKSKFDAEIAIMRRPNAEKVSDLTSLSYNGIADGSNRTTGGWIGQP